MAVYPRTLLSVNGGSGVTSDGVVVFTGNKKFYAGDIVWTDGQYVYGLQHRASVAIMPDDSVEGLPILAEKVGYYVRSLDWSDFELSKGDGIVNDETQYFALKGEYADADTLIAQSGKSSGGYIAIEKEGPSLEQTFKNPNGDINMNDFFRCSTATYMDSFNGKSYENGDKETIKDELESAANLIKNVDKNDNKQDYDLGPSIMSSLFKFYIYYEDFQWAQNLRSKWINYYDKYPDTQQQVTPEMNDVRVTLNMDGETKKIDIFSKLGSLFQKEVTDFLQKLDDASKITKSTILAGALPFSSFSSKNRDKVYISNILGSCLLKKVYSNNNWLCVIEISIICNVPIYTNLNGDYTIYKVRKLSNSTKVLVDKDADIYRTLDTYSYTGSTEANKRYTIFEESREYKILLQINANSEVSVLYRGYAKFEKEAYRFIEPKVEMKKLGYHLMHKHNPNVMADYFDYYVPDEVEVNKNSPFPYNADGTPEYFQGSFTTDGFSSVEPGDISYMEYHDTSHYVPALKFFEGKEEHENFQIEMQDGFYIEYTWQGKGENLKLKQDMYSPNKGHILTLNAKTLGSNDNIHFANFAITETQTDESGQMVYLLLNQTTGKLFSVKNGSATELMSGCKNFRLRFMQDIYMAAQG